MKQLVVGVVWMCLLIGVVVQAAEPVEGPKACLQCGMDRTVYAQSRTLLRYADGSSAGFCSLHCAAAAMAKEPEKAVQELLVADYATGGLIEASTAIWVVGGKKAGVMTAEAKWAFAKQEAADGFIRENGGEVRAYPTVWAATKAEAAGGGKMGGGHGGHHHDMGPGALMEFNPAFGDDVYHLHPAGMWMVNAKTMRMSMDGLRDGTTNVGVDKVIPMNGSQYGYMMAPTSMLMEMDMFMVMYGVTDRLTVMGMANYQDNQMEMLMNMGMGKGNKAEPPMRTSGIGDTEVRAMYGLGHHLVGSLGVGLPTGDITQEMRTMGRKYRAPYEMQLGSGTVDLKPALTFSALSADAKWNWGGQASYVYHLDTNDEGYSLGDSLKVNGWLQRAFGPAAGWLRLTASTAGAIDGRDPEIQKSLDPNPRLGASSPDADPKNYGGQRLDGFVGTSVSLGRWSLGMELGLPLYQNLNGLQMKNDWYLTAGVQTMF